MSVRTPFNASRRYGSFSLATLPLLLIACGDDTSSTPSAGTLGVTLGAAYCNQLTTCALSNGSSLREATDESILALFASQAPEGCADFVAKRLLPSFDTLVAEKKLCLDATKLDDCITSIRETCDAEEPVSLPTCKQALVGLVSIGGACEDSVECAGDAWCRPLDANGCGGTCMARVALGGSCDDSRACSQTVGAAECESEQQVCRRVPATREAAAGEKCGFDGESEPGEIVCGPGFACVLETIDTVCRPLLAPGAACGVEGGGVCAAGTLCGQKDGGPPTCLPLQVVSTAGGACNEGDDAKPFAACNSFKSLTCGDPGTCETASGKAGSQCNHELALACNEGLTCDFETGRCVAALADGQPCDYDDMCRSNHCREDSTCGQPECQ
jgi:hypothetical protein